MSIGCSGRPGLRVQSEGIQIEWKISFTAEPNTGTWVVHLDSAILPWQKPYNFKAAEYSTGRPRPLLYSVLSLGHGKPPELHVVVATPC